MEKQYGGTGESLGVQLKMLKKLGGGGGGAKNRQVRPNVNQKHSLFSIYGLNTKHILRKESGGH